MMEYRRLGKSNLQVSSVGFGTCQLRLVSEQQALESLIRGFELGVNFVHTSPDYEGTDTLVARAIVESGREVIVLTQGYGKMDHFEWLFENTCRKFNKQRLEIYGIACIDDREYLGENVWDKGGMIEFLLEKKRQGRLGSIYCTTHGPPHYVSRLITCGIFDAIMISYNSLGFHLLSYNPGAGKEFEDIPSNRKIIFPLAASHDVGLVIMKPLAGGLLCQSKAFPPHNQLSHESASLSARDILRTLLSNQEVSCVMPGTASLAEAEENARAGHKAPATPEISARVEQAACSIRTGLCSRCGQCDPLCSKKLHISWLFRDAYINNYPSETFETIDALQYFHLHPEETAVCRNCIKVTCHCPHGIDIPGTLVNIHDQMLKLRSRGMLPALPDQLSDICNEHSSFSARLVRKDIPIEILAGQTATCRLYLQNNSARTWFARSDDKKRKSVYLEVTINNKPLAKVALRHDVEPATRTHFAFDFVAPSRPCEVLLKFRLVESFGSFFFQIGKTQFDLLVAPLAVRSSQDKLS